MIQMLCYMVICKAPLTGSYSEALSAWQARKIKDGRERVNIRKY